MAVGGAVVAVVAQADVVAVAVVPAGELHHAVAGGEDRRARRRGEVDALVHAGVAEDRVEPHAERRGDAGPVDGRAEQRLAQRPALAVEIAGAPVAPLEAVGLDPPVLQLERGVGHPLAADELATVVHGPLQHDLEPVAGLEVALEVDVPAQHLDQLAQRLPRQAGPARGVVEAILDLGRDTHRVPVHRPADAAGRERPVRRARQPHDRRRVGVEREAGERGPVVREPDGDRLPGPQPARVVGLPQGLDGVVRLLGRHALAQQQVEERLAAPHPHLAAGGGRRCLRGVGHRRAAPARAPAAQVPRPARSPQAPRPAPPPVPPLRRPAPVRAEAPQPLARSPPPRGRTRPPAGRPGSPPVPRCFGLPSTRTCKLLFGATNRPPWSSRHPDHVARAARCQSIYG